MRFLRCADWEIVRSGESAAGVRLAEEGAAIQSL